MHFLIETEEQLNKLRHEEECFVQVIPGNYFYHPKLTYASLYYYRNSEKGYIICCKHSESFSIDEESIKRFISKHKKIYVIDRKYHSYFLKSEPLIDLLFCSIQDTGNLDRPDFKTQLQQDYEKRFFKDKDVNEIIPISKHYEHLEIVYDYYKKYVEGNKISKSINDVIDAYYYVENSKVGVNKHFFDVYSLHDIHFSYDGKGVYTLYNMYNHTGRPTNTFNGVNFLAIPKEENHRTCIVPLKDYFVEFDFDGYHIRLIASCIGYNLPKESVHEYLGKMYFSKDQLSEEEYKASKTLTFKQLYGGVFEEYKHLDFYVKMQVFIEDLYSQYTRTGYIVLPTGVKLHKSEETTKLKLFNYFIQNLETKVNSDKILKLKVLLDKKRTELVLITYDAFLFDFDKADGKDLLLDIKAIMEENGYITKHKHGTNYFL